MVLRIKKRNRKYFGSRSWGAGNIKNRRGAGSRGGVGKAGRKHKFTRMVIYEKERVRGKGFNPWIRYELKEANLEMVMKRARESKEAKPVVELKGYKVLGNGNLEKPIVVKANKFSKKAIEKITNSGGEAVKI